MPILKITQESVVSQKTMAFVLGLSESRVDQLAKEERLVKTDTGKYKLVSSINTYILSLKLNETLDEARLRKTQEEIQKLEIENAQKRGELVEVVKVDSFMKEVFTNIKNQLLNVPQKLSPLLISKQDFHEVKQILETEIDNILNELAKKP